MWPKVFSQLVELLPHISRLIPMADVFFQTKSAGEKAQEAVQTELARDVRRDLAAVTSSHDSLYRQLHGLATQQGEIAADLSRSRAAVEDLAEQLSTQQRQLAALKNWVIAAIVLLVFVFAGLLTILIAIKRAA